jgi:hypothetical protein
MRSVFIRQPRPAPFRYMLDMKELCETYGISLWTARKAKQQWLTQGYGPFARPIPIRDGNRVCWRYYWEEVTQNSDGTFLKLMKQDQARFLARKADKETNTRRTAA